MGATVLEYLGWFFLTVVKFLITPSTMIGLGYSWLGTIITVFVSAFIGFNCFYYFGEVMFQYLAKKRKRPGKRFSKMNRFIVGMKMRYGLLGLGLRARFAPPQLDHAIELVKRCLTMEAEGWP